MDDNHERGLTLCLESFTFPELSLTLSGTGGGGGSEAQMTKLTADNQKPLTL